MEFIRIYNKNMIHSSLFLFLNSLKKYCFSKNFWLCFHFVQRTTILFLFSLLPFISFIFFQKLFRIDNFLYIPSNKQENYSFILIRRYQNLKKKILFISLSRTTFMESMVWGVGCSLRWFNNGVVYGMYK